MQPGHRIVWLEATLRLIADDKLPNIVTLLNVRYKHMHQLVGERLAPPTRNLASSLPRSCLTEGHFFRGV